MSKANEPQAAVQLNAETPRLLYNYREAREKLGGVPKSTFALWIARGLIKPVRLGPRRCFVRAEDLIRLAQGNNLPKGA
jgi:hypothetical protein